METGGRTNEKGREVESKGVIVNDDGCLAFHPVHFIRSGTQRSGCSYDADQDFTLLRRVNRQSRQRAVSFGEVPERDTSCVT